MAQLKSSLITGTLDVTGAISQKGIALSNTYLGKTDTATNSAKLNNQDPSYYLAWANITDKPTNLVTTNSNGKIPESYLPSYVDDVIEGYYYNSKFYKESSHTTIIAAESGKIYIDLATNKTYRWSGSAYAEISASLALGETSATAYAGDKGKANATNIAALQTTVNNALALNAGTNVNFTTVGNELTISAEGSIKKVNNQEPDNNGNVSITLDNINDGSTRKLANYLPLSGGTMTGNLTFNAVSSTSYPASSNRILWSGSTDGAAIYYRVDASDAGRLVFQTADDSNCNFVWNNTVSGNGDVMTLTGNGNLTVKGDITSKGNKVALDKDVVKLTGDQNISGIKSFSNKIINTYLQHGVMDIHPDNNGTIISYYTNDLGYLFERGGSCVATNITQNNKAITVPADAFDCSPTYWYLSLSSTSDVVQILVKTSQVYSYGTRGGIGFGHPAWRAKDVKIEVGYSATNTGTASSPDTDIVWVTKIDVTRQGEGIVYGNINGPSAAEGGNSANNSAWSYMRLTLTNWATVNPRIAQIFSVTYNSRGLHNAFLSKNGGYVYGNILPSNNNRYLGNGSENWAAVYARFFYENGTSLADKYLGINGTAKTTNKLVSPNTRPTSANFEHEYINNFVSQRLDISSSSMTTGTPGHDGFITTYFWDNNGAADTQLFIPNKDYSDGRLRVRYRYDSNNNDANWNASWKSIPYTSDLDNYTKKTVTIPDNTSLDTVTESGFYRLSTNPNFPHAQMIVSRGADTIAQMAFPYADTTMYVRTGNPFHPSGGLWHNWKQVAFTDNINNGTLELATNGTGISGSATFTANQSGNSAFTVTLDSSAAGNRGANKVVLAKAAGQIDSDKFTVTSAGTTKATMQYNSTEDCIEFIFA